MLEDSTFRWRNPVRPLLYTSSLYEVLLQGWISVCHISSRSWPEEEILFLNTEIRAYTLLHEINVRQKLTFFRRWTIIHVQKLQLSERTLINVLMITDPLIQTNFI